MNSHADICHSWSRDGRYLLTSSQDWKCILWDLADGSRVRTVRFEAPVYIAELHPFNQYSSPVDVISWQLKLIIYIVSSLSLRSLKTNPSWSTSHPPSPSSASSPRHRTARNPKMVKQWTLPWQPSKQHRMPNIRPASPSSRRSGITSSVGPPKGGSTSSRQRLARRSTRCGCAMG